MKHNKTLTALALSSALLLAACGSPAASSPASSGTPAVSDTGITITDMRDRVVTLDGPAERVIALSAADCEIIYALGAEDKLIGRGEYCDWPAEVLELPAVASGRNTNMEQLLAMQPDVLITADMDQPEEQYDQLAQAGIDVIVSDADTIDGVYQSILNTGAALGKSDEAEAMVASMKHTFQTITEQSADEGKTVYFEVSPLEYGLWAAGNDTFMNAVAEMMHLENIFSDVSGWCEVSEEQIIERAPDYIVTVGMAFEGQQPPAEEILGRAGWQNIPAVANGKVLHLANNELSRPGPRLAEGAQTLFDFVNE